MKIEQLLPKPDNKVPFKLSSYKNVPKISGCYVLSTFENDILYIGLSDNLYNRFKQHLDNPEKTYPTPNGKAVWFYYMEYDKINLPKLERTWLNQFEGIHGELPILNKVHSPIK
jgi:hypothetical protein